MNLTNRPTIGLALSGSGNRSSFYVGFLEKLSQAGIPIDYISAMSGGSLVAGAYATGTLQEFKAKIFTINKETIKQYISKSHGGGLYSLELLEQELNRMFKGKTFEEVSPKMAFVAADIETGEQVVLCVGDIARAACISCVLPGVFEPVMWGSRILVDGGILNQMPLDVVKSFGADIIIGVSVRGTKHIFTSNQMQLKKVLNTFKKFLFIGEIGSWFTELFHDEDTEHDFSKKPNLFSVLGKSMDLAIKANSSEKEMPEADLTIKLNMSKINRTEFNEESIKHYYELGLQTADEYIPQIKAIIEQKEKVLLKV